MDAFWKCLLACVMSLAAPANDTNSAHLMSTHDLAKHFSNDREIYQDLVIDLLIEDQPPQHLALDPNKSDSVIKTDYSIIKSQMKKLGISSITVNDRTILFGLGQHDDPSKQLVWHPNAFAQLKTGGPANSPVSLYKLDDDWAILSVNTSCSN